MSLEQWHTLFTSVYIVLGIGYPERIIYRFCSVAVILSTCIHCFTSLKSAFACEILKIPGVILYVYHVILPRLIKLLSYYTICGLSVLAALEAVRPLLAMEVI
jgi:hypothetical protein